MLFKVVSVLVACTAKEVATSTTSTPSSTLASSTTTSTSMAPRILRRQLNKSAEERLKNFNPIDFHSSTFVGKINYEEFGTGQPIGKWGAKVATILGFVGLAGGLVCGVLDQVLATEWSTGGSVFVGTKSFYNTEQSLVYTGLSALIFPNVYGLWKVKSARKAYGIMLVIDVVSYSVYGTIIYTGFLQTSPFLKRALSIVAQCALAFVFLFNWYKVLYPTWTGIKDW